MAGAQSHSKRPGENLLGGYFKTHVMNVDKDQDAAQRPSGEKTAKKAEGISLLTDGKDGDFNSGFFVRRI